MRIPIPVECPYCRGAITLEVQLHDRQVDAACPKCSARLKMPLPLDLQNGFKVLYRGREELNNKDWAASIVFSAMAFDCDLSFRYLKWRRIHELLSLNQISDEDLEIEMRRFGTVDRKIEQVCSLLHAPGLDDFVATDAELRIAVDQSPDLNQGSLAQEFQQKLFWPRNRILHLGWAATEFRTPLFPLRST